jgi:endonuclease/exonuclease/phosphatase family metal-dependent hydrolase
VQLKFFNLNMRLKLKKIIRVCFVAATLFTILFYLQACLVPFLEAGNHWFIALLGLVFPLLFFVLLLFFIYWVIIKSRWAVLCGVALLFGWQQISVSFSFRTVKKFDIAKTPETLRVLSWNLSSWGETNRGKKKNYMNAMLHQVKNVNADIICFQEYLYYKNSRYRDSIHAVLKEAGYQYAYFAKTNYTERFYTSAVLTAVVIMSKHPIVDTAQFIYSKEDFAEPLIYADIKKNDQIIRVFTTHLQSLRFENNEYDALHLLKEPGMASINQSRSMLWKLRQGYKKRSAQAELVHTKIEESPYPVVLCGDFNDVPNSYAYFTIKGNLQDAFLKKGVGFGRTFRFISPTLRIDYILADKKFTVQQFGKIEVDYSDHYPIISDLVIDE